jgi:Domain of unknown function (DUF4878)
LVVAVLAVSLVGLPGCGSSKSDADEAKDTMKAFLSALAKGDGKKACSLADASGRDRLVQAAKGRLSCEGVVKAVAARLPAGTKTGLENAEIKKITVSGNTATIQDTDITSSKGDVSALLSGGRPTKLVKEGGSWKVSGTGG